MRVAPLGAMSALYWARQFALRTFKRAQIGTSKAGLDSDQHHANFALGAARPLDHAKGMRFGHVLHSICFRRERNTLSVTDAHGHNLSR